MYTFLILNLLESICHAGYTIRHAGTSHGVSALLELVSEHPRFAPARAPLRLKKVQNASIQLNIAGSLY